MGEVFAVTRNRRAIRTAAQLIARLPIGPRGETAAECGEGRERTRTRQVTTASCCGGAECPKELVDKEECELVCCPCKEGDWSDWSPKLPECGTGTASQSRSRKVEQYAIPADPCATKDEYKCSAPETRDVTLECCPDEDCPLDDWKDWGACSATCEGKRTRRVIQNQKYARKRKGQLSARQQMTSHEIRMRIVARAAQ